MSRVSFTTARTGRRPGSGRGRGIVEDFKWEMGDRIRLTLPIIDGELVIFSSPVHKVETRGTVSNKKRQGGTYALNEIRCTHLYSQISPKEQKKILEKGETCLFCDLALYESRQQLEAIEEAFGKDGFGKLTKEEQKAFYTEYDKKNPRTVSNSYYTEVDSEGNRTNRTHTSMSLLVLRFEVDDKGKPIIDPNTGVYKYTPQLMSVSTARLEKFVRAVEDVMAVGSLDESTLHPIGEGEDTVYIGYVDFMLHFPRESKKMESGKNLSVTPITQSPIPAEFIAEFEKNADKVLEDAEAIVNGLYKNLQIHSREQAKDFITRGDMTGADYFQMLEDKYRKTERYMTDDGREMDSDDERDAKIFATVAEQLEEVALEEDSDTGAGAVQTGGAVKEPEKKRTMEDLTPEEQERVRQYILKKKQAEEQAKREQAESKLKAEQEELVHSLDDFDDIL